MDRLDEIRKREQAATKGPWYYAPDTMSGGADGGQLRFGNPYGRPAWMSFGFRDYKGEKPDGEFMAHAREDIPYLLAALDAATAERDALKARVKELEAALERGRTPGWQKREHESHFISSRRCPRCSTWMVKETPPAKPWVCAMCGWTDKEAKPDA